MAANLIDIALALALIAFILYILAITHVIAWTGGAIHVLLVISLILLAIWVFIRLFRGRRAANSSIV